MLTDGDVNALMNLRRNVRDNSSPLDNDAIQVRQLIWGDDTAEVFQHDHGSFDYVFGSDLLYSNRLAIRQLFETVDKLMTEGGKFVIAHSVRYDVRLETILQGAKFHRLLYEIVGRVGEIYVVVYRRMSMSSVGPLLDRLRFQMDKMRTENDELKSANKNLEDRTRCLEDRILELRGDVQSDIVGLDEDVFIDVSAFLETSDLATLSATCRHFGLRRHRLTSSAGDGGGGGGGEGGQRLVSFVERMAYSEYTTATDEERRCLPAYDPEANDDDAGTSGSVLFYRNELVELRKPLRFDQILGRGISHSFGDRAKIVNANIGRIKRTVSLDRAWLF